MRVKLKSGLIGRAAYYYEDTVFVYDLAAQTFAGHADPKFKTVH